MSGSNGQDLRIPENSDATAPLNPSDWVFTDIAHSDNFQVERAYACSSAWATHAFIDESIHIVS
jgi:hypothetical protein